MKSLNSGFSIMVRDIYFQFQTAAGVFSRGRLDPGTGLLAENMFLPDEGDMLDLGCGYGPLGIIAAKLKPKLRVTLTEKDSSALKLAKLNATLNRVKNIEFKLGNVYDPIQGLKFRAILTNPPLSAGFSVVSKMIREAPLHLGVGGTLQLVVRKGFNIYRRECEGSFGNAEVLARGSGYRVYYSKLTKT